MKPALVVLDSRARTVRQYWPKPDGGFLTQEAVICAPEDQDASFAGVLEQFRLGKLKLQPVQTEPEAA